MAVSRYSILALATILSCQPQEPAQRVGQLELTPVTVRTHEGPEQSAEAEEGSLYVPERWEDTTGATIKLHFYRYAATGDEPGPPIVYLAGGPGGSGSGSSSGDRFPFFQALREAGDVIAWDQRGANGTEPRLVCPNSYDYPLDVPADPEIMTPILEGFAEECVAHWEAQGVDLAAYHTNASADDLEALRVALGAEQLTLWGISYGTHLALAYMRRYPDRVHKAVLAGVEGPAHTLKLPSNLDRTLARADSLVKTDPEARAIAPDIVGTTRAIMERLEREPVFVQAPGPGGDPVTVALSKFDVQDAFVDLLGDDEDIALLAVAVRALGEGDFSPLAAVEASQRRGRRASAMAAAMDCASGVSPERRARIAREAETSILGDAVNFPFPEICEFFPHTDLGPEFRSPVSGDMPVLFISGTLDARTPPSNAEEVQAGFPNSEHMIIENGTHDDDLLIVSPLILQGVLQFLRGEPVSEPRIRLDREFVTTAPWEN
ncbi:MAG: alpha/beta fold hydrolase [Gemmatimonadota bacterium]|nr:MAG: alpha/beta fold hydrolase [Gemmatimonadota bacterium]